MKFGLNVPNFGVTSDRTLPMAPKVHILTPDDCLITESRTADGSFDFAVSGSTGNAGVTW